MKTTDITALEGPNRYHHQPVLRVRFEAPEFLRKECQCNKAQLAQALATILPNFEANLAAAQTSKSGLATMDLLPAIALSLQNLNGDQLSFHQSTVSARQEPSQAAFEIVFAYESQQVARMAVPLSVRILIAVLQRDLEITFPENLQAPDHFDIAKQIDLFATAAVPYQLDSCTRLLTRALEKQHIPWHRIDDSSSLIQAGYGKQRKLIRQTYNSDSSALASSIAQDPLLCHTLLSRSGLPLVRQALVTNPDQALFLISSFPYPLMVKAAHGSQSPKGLKVNDELELRDAFRQAQQKSSSVIIEPHLKGRRHRFFIIGKKVVAISQAQNDSSHKHAPLILDHDDNDDIHPDNIALIERCAAIIGLDLLSIDFISTDLSRSHLEVTGFIHNLQCNPELPPINSERQHSQPDLADQIIRQWFPPTHSASGLIPIVSICGSNGKTTTCRMVDAILRQAGHFTGMSNSDGIYIDGQLTIAGKHDGFHGARSILADSRVEAAVLEADQKSILQQGLAFSACSVSAVLNITPDPVSFDRPDSLEGMSEIKQLVASQARDTIVLNADDPLCIDMIRELGGRPLSLVTRDPDNTTIMIPAAEISSIITLSQGKSSHVQNIVIRSGGEDQHVLKTLDIPATHDGLAQHQVDNAMFAVAITHSLGIDLESIQKGLRRFTGDFDNNPGRCNLIHDKEFTVILDFGNNPQAIEATADFVENLEAEGKRIAILSAPTSLRPEHYLAMAEAAADGFDHIICSNHYTSDAKQYAEVPAAFEQALNNCGFDADEITLCPDPDQSIRTAMQQLEETDTLVIFGDQPSRRRQVALETLQTNPL
ncbi:MAG: hypothetical protein L3J39_09480 [Verrucomicrobiales bacterium]|nr:hypothetical protein [Verrucomicrobiales bacterium]